MKIGRPKAILTAIVMACLSPVLARAGTMEVLYDFPSSWSGWVPSLAPQLGANGTIYGTTLAGGGSCSCGIVFSLTPATHALTVLHTFAGGADQGPGFGGVVVGPGDILYGVSLTGGAHDSGRIFQLDPATKTLTTLYDFAALGPATPSAVTLRNGILYGLTGNGGTGFGGTGFSFDLGTSRFKVLHSFTSAEGIVPESKLAFGSKGFAFGTTFTGGANGNGSVFRLNPRTGAVEVLYSFKASDGLLAGADEVTVDAGQRPVGLRGGKNSTGEVYRIAPTTGRLSVLHVFSTSAGGQYPLAGVVFGPLNHLYGVTSTGGPSFGGTLFELDPVTKAFTNVFAFGSDVQRNGTYPAGLFPTGRLVSAGGALYGSTGVGGKYVTGTIFKFTP